jgi:PadR family transcriptional regulator, regulatory protein PadR
LGAADQPQPVVAHQRCAGQPDRTAARIGHHARVARATRKAVAEAAPLDEARSAAGARSRGGAGSADPLAGELRRAGLLHFLVLHLLQQEPSYGNRLMEGIEERTGGLLAVNPNTMYPLLRSLEADGLVAGEWEHPERRSRRFYRLTDAGRVERERLAAELQPRLERVAASIERLRAEVSA